MFGAGYPIPTPIGAYRTESPQTEKMTLNGIGWAQIRPIQVNSVACDLMKCGEVWCGSER